MPAEIYWIEAGSHGQLAIVGRPRSGDWLADEIRISKARGSRVPDTDEQRKWLSMAISRHTTDRK